MSILVTGAAGFIGFHLTEHLLTNTKQQIIAIDNLNPYYDVNLKKSRLSQLRSTKKFIFYQIDIADNRALKDCIAKHPDITHIAHLAAQAGVRYSLTNPKAYADSNLIGHLNILEVARSLKQLQHLVYASSSSVYGGNKKLPFAVQDRVDKPISLYAATKRSAELMTHAYSHLFQIPATGLRFFTVYGPWGRPDMSAFIFTKAMLADEKIPVFNDGEMQRNFTYIDDIIQGTYSALFKAPNTNCNPKIYNIGNDRAEHLMDFIKTLENILGKTANIEPLLMQPGDVKTTVADIKNTTEDLGYKPTTNIQEGLEKFVAWYREYYNA